MGKTRKSSSQEFFGVDSHVIGFLSKLHTTVPASKNKNVLPTSLTSPVGNTINIPSNQETGN